MKNKSKPMLSIGMIVKNEEVTLEKCLKALQPLRDSVSCELVIADTGSTDKTKEIASKYADILFDFQWIDDFSAARNAVMDRCSGKWYLSIDADEYMDSTSVNEFTQFFNSKQSNNAQGAFITINNYSNENDEKQYNQFYALRLVRLIPEMRFYGRIHETFDEKLFNTVYYLKKTIFWHDGYLQIKKNLEKDKSKRNIKLLEKELENDPENVFRVLQILESLKDRNEIYKYTLKILDLVERGVDNSDKIAPIAYHHATKYARKYGFFEFDKWKKISLEKYPDSIYTKIDINYLMAEYSMEIKEYAAVIEYAQKYFNSLPELKEDRVNSELQVSVLEFAGENFQQSAAIDMAMAYFNTEQYDKVKEIIKRYSYDKICINATNQWLNVVVGSWQKIDYTNEFIHLGKVFYKNEIDNEDKLMLDRKNILDSFIIGQFVLEDKEQIPMYPMIAALGDCDLSYAARIMLSENENEIMHLAESINSWIDLPKNVFGKIMQFKFALPRNFYFLSVDNMQDIAGQYVADLDKENAVITVLDWLDSVSIQSYPKDIVWRYDLIIAAIRVANWEENYCEYREELLAIYLKSTEHFLNLYYNNSVLCEDLIDMIPSMHAFAWFIVKYNKEKLNNNLKQCIYWLRKAIKVAPVMKSMVKYLLQNIEAEMNNSENQIPQEVSPEFLALAEKVRTILNAYPQDDPAVFAIKQSEVYKKVAYLIEKPASDYKM